MEHKSINRSHHTDEAKHKNNQTNQSPISLNHTPDVSLILRLQQQIGNRQVAHRLQNGLNNPKTNHSASVIQRDEDESSDQMDTVKNVKSLYDLGVGAADIAGADTTMPGIYGDVGGIMFDVLQSAERGENVQDALLNASGTAIGGKFASEQYGGDKISGMVDTSINAINSGAQMMGAPQEVQDVTQITADVTPSTFMQQVGSTGFKAYGDIAEGAVTGNWNGVDNLVQSMQEGDTGAPLQGYGLMAEIIPDLASGKSVEDTIIDAGSRGQDSAIGRAGSYLGDEAYQFINKDLPEASEFFMKDMSDLFSSSGEPEDLEYGM